MGFVTGGQMANTTCLTVARHAVLGAGRLGRRGAWPAGRSGRHGRDRRRGARVDPDGAAHARARLGDAATRRPSTGRAGCAPTSSRASSPTSTGPTIVCAQAGNVNTGAMRPARRGRGRPAGPEAPGCTSTARSDCGPRSASGSSISSPAASSPTRGRSTATSGSTSHRTRASRSAPIESLIARRSGRRRRTSCRRRATITIRSSSCPEWSRRARGFPAYAALRSLGRAGVVELVERCCDARVVDGRGARGRGRRRGAERGVPQPGARPLRRTTTSARAR